VSAPVLVLGGEGMLGHKMFQVLRGAFPDAHCTLRGGVGDVPLPGRALFDGGGVVEHVDVMDRARLDDVLTTLRPAVIVNCVGIIKQRSAARDPIPSIAINALLPHVLAALAAGWGGRLIHFSTDCIFSGRRGQYTEDDASDAEDLYGRTKFLGEVATDNAVTLRTSMIGRELAEHRSLLDWFLQQHGGRVRGFTRVIYAGVTTNYLAGVVSRLLASPRDLHGLFQVASEPISKHQLLVLLREAYGVDVEIVPDDSEVSDRSMVGERFRRATDFQCPSWPELVRELAADPTPYRQWST
jgi:dTDP-4-dehydrorhamnose reductase